MSGPCATVREPVYLLNRTQIDKAKKAADLSIGGFSADQLEHTFYYVRLGMTVERSTRDGWKRQDYRDGDSFELAAGGCVRVRSLETFALSARVFGILGSKSDLADEGVALLHGPFVDPLYPRGSRKSDAANEVVAPLHLALVNHSQQPFKLTCGHTEIAKLCLFNVADTYPVKLKKGSPADKKFQERQEGG
jgi:deoxycytidine triphosphate deaminase